MRARRLREGGPVAAYRDASSRHGRRCCRPARSRRRSDRSRIRPTPNGTDSTTRRSCWCPTTRPSSPPLRRRHTRADRHGHARRGHRGVARRCVEAVTGSSCGPGERYPGLLAVGLRRNSRSARRPGEGWPGRPSARARPAVRFVSLPGALRVRLPQRGPVPCRHARVSLDVRTTSAHCCGWRLAGEAQRGPPLLGLFVFVLVGWGDRSAVDLGRGSGERK